MINILLCSGVYMKQSDIVRLGHGFKILSSFKTPESEVVARVMGRGLRSSSIEAVT
jgi:hypothetical protein